MASPHPTRLPVAAISFLNPAPLMWDFEHAPRAAELATRYDVHYTQPALCALELHEGRAALGLIPIASLTPELAIVPGCVIASPDRVRSIQLVVKQSLLGSAATVSDPAHPTVLDHILKAIRTVAADTASRSSLAYVQLLFRRFLNTDPEFTPTPAAPIPMLRRCDAALLIGDPALLAIEHRTAIEADPAIGPCLWIDIAHQWRLRTSLPWVAAVWAVRRQALREASISPSTLLEDLNRSRDAGLANIPALVQEWAPRVPLPPATVNEYLTRNIQYSLTPECVGAIQLFRRYAAEAGILPGLPELHFLQPGA